MNEIKKSIKNPDTSNTIKSTIANELLKTIPDIQKKEPPKVTPPKKKK